MKRVDQLSRTQDNALVAWVSGSERYATMVRIEKAGDFDDFCTCPYSWGPCKHAVAVVLAAAERVKRKEAIPTLDEDDDLSLTLFGNEDEEADAREDDEQGARTKVENILEEKSREELLDLMITLASRYPEVQRSILEAEQIVSGRVDTLVRTLRSEIRNLTAEPAWYNHWRDEGNLPDYSHLEEQLQALLDQDHADAVLQLGAELWTQGNTQVEQSDDEGETDIAITACMEVVLNALPQSSLSPPEQLLWVMNRLLEDEFSMLDSAEKLLKRRAYNPTCWRAVAGTLENRLQALPRPRNPSFSETYRRERLLDQLIEAYGRARWKDRIIPLLEAEADACRCYARLVDALLAASEQDRARHWCIHGYARTAEDAPGIAKTLQDRLREMAQSQRRYDLVAAYRAQDFFARPSRASYSDLRKMAEKAKCWPGVRTTVLHYLETGQQPTPGGRKGDRTGWPLPFPEVEPPTTKKRVGYQRFPYVAVLIDIAILEKRLDDVIELYQRLSKTERWGWETDKTVAQAVANTHPDVALGIWQTIIDNLIGQVKPKAYEEAAVYLRQMKKVYTRNQRLTDWQALLDRLRRDHKAKRRLMGVLDTLSKKKIVG